MPAYTIGNTAESRVSSVDAVWTHIDFNNRGMMYAGYTVSIELYFLSDATYVHVSPVLFYEDGYYFHLIGTESTTIPGTVSSGATQTYSGLLLATPLGCSVGIHFDTGSLANDGSGYGARSYTYEDTIEGGGGNCTVAGYTLSVKLNCVTVATVTTQAASSVKQTTATGNGNITDSGGATVTERGICYSLTSTTPTTSDSTSHDHTNSEGAFTMSLTGLLPGRLYYARAYCITATGTAYGDVVQFTTLDYPKIWIF